MILTPRPKPPARPVEAIKWDGSANAVMEIRDKLADRPECVLVTLHVSGKPVPLGSYVVKELNGALSILSQSEVAQEYLNPND